jgi:SET domain-containing protein
MVIDLILFLTFLGWGCFIGEEAEKGDFIAEYVGEIISQDEVERRGGLYDRVKSSYVFALNADYALDAARWASSSLF